MPNVVEVDQRFQLPGFQSIVEYSGLVPVRAAGSWITTHEGQDVLDVYNGVGACNIGHAHPLFKRSLHDQIERVIAGTFYSPARSQLLQRIAEVLPAGLSRTQLYTTGSEAVEAAIRFARGATGRTSIVSAWGGFHGKTSGSLALHGGPRRRGWAPFMPGVVHIPYAYEHGCSLKYCCASGRCADAALELARQALAASADGPPAAIIVEPVQGTAGNLTPAPGYLAGLRILADDLGAVLVFDEVITGCGRTGAMTAAAAFDVQPDVLILGKALGSGYPVSALVVREEFVTRENPFFEPSTGSSTFGGNPLASAAALATLRVLEEEDLVRRGAQVGAQLNSGLRELQQAPNSAVGTVYAAGPMLGVRLVEPATGEPPSPSQCVAFFRALLQERVLAMAYGPVVRLYPSLAMTNTEVEFFLEAFARATRIIGMKQCP